MECPKVKERVKLMTDQRTFTRVPFIQSLKWEDMSGNQGAAKVQDVGRGGISIQSNSYLRPGPMITLLFGDLEFESNPIELQALITWCKPDSDHSNSFHVGMSWVYGEQRTLTAVSEVFYSAIHQHAVSDHFVSY
jgi:hypothetical protein